MYGMNVVRSTRDGICASTVRGGSLYGASSLYSTSAASQLLPNSLRSLITLIWILLFDVCFTTMRSTSASSLTHSASIVSLSLASQWTSRLHLFFQAFTWFNENPVLFDGPYKQLCVLCVSVFLLSFFYPLSDGPLEHRAAKCRARSTLIAREEVTIRDCSSFVKQTKHMCEAIWVVWNGKETNSLGFVWSFC